MERAGSIPKIIILDESSKKFGNELRAPDIFRYEVVGLFFEMIMLNKLILILDPVTLGMLSSYTTSEMRQSTLSLLPPRVPVGTRPSEANLSPGHEALGSGCTLPLRSVVGLERNRATTSPLPSLVQEPMRYQTTVLKYLKRLV
ncbi:hypothetical protein HAX54_011975 [Datura stramonium]|uniref:Uncharacterized protein n=1 Tax=Datura stramonium TaxID=4076 RepID=A0ABS8TJ01_DATST|nr:hypothetical protein [Datura stramonium]